MIKKNMRNSANIRTRGSVIFEMVSFAVKIEFYEIFFGADIIFKWFQNIF